MIIYDRLGGVLVEVMPTDDSHVSNQLMGDSYAEVHFSLSSFLDIPIGSYVIINSVAYTLFAPPDVRKVHSKLYEYSARFSGSVVATGLVIVRNMADKRVSFPLTATPQEHIQLIVDNLNRADSGWSLGACISGAEKLVTYDYTNCRDALNLIAEAFNTEWEVAGKTISLRKVERFAENPLRMAYGRGNGFVSGIVRRCTTEEAPVSRLYPQGSNRNIDPQSYGNKSLILPRSRRLGYDGEKFGDEEGYRQDRGVVFVTDNTGMYVSRELTSPGMKEASIDCTEIYPSRVGTVTRVETIQTADDDLFDIVDTTIPPELDYQANLIRNGEPLNITFQSGMLAGKTFNCQYFHEAVGSSLPRRFEIEPQEIDGVVMPGGVYVPAEGDEYIITNCTLPNQYICDNDTHTGASWAMLRKCIAWMYEYGKQGYIFSGDVDTIWARGNWESVAMYMEVGSSISFYDEDIIPAGTVMRVTSTKRYINNQYKIELTLSNKPKKYDFMTDFVRVASASSLIDSESRARMRRGNGESIGVRKAVFGDKIPRPGLVVPLSDSVSKNSGNMSICGDNFGSLGLFGGETSTALSMIVGIIKHNFNALAKGEKYSGYEQIAEVEGGELVEVDDNTVIPIAPTLKKLE